MGKDVRIAVRVSAMENLKFGFNWYMSTKKGTAVFSRKPPFLFGFFSFFSLPFSLFSGCRFKECTAHRDFPGALLFFNRRLKNSQQRRYSHWPLSMIQWRKIQQEAGI